MKRPDAIDERWEKYDPLKSNVVAGDFIKIVRNDSSPRVLLVGDVNACFGACACCDPTTLADAVYFIKGELE